MTVRAWVTSATPPLPDRDLDALIRQTWTSPRNRTETQDTVRVLRPWFARDPKAVAHAVAARMAIEPKSSWGDVLTVLQAKRVTKAADGSGEPLTIDLPKSVSAADIQRATKAIMADPRVGVSMLARGATGGWLTGNEWRPSLDLLATAVRQVRTTDPERVEHMIQTIAQRDFTQTPLGSERLQNIVGHCCICSDARVDRALLSQALREPLINGGGEHQHVAVLVAMTEAADREPALLREFLQDPRHRIGWFPTDVGSEAALRSVRATWSRRLADTDRQQWLLQEPNDSYEMRLRLLSMTSDVPAWQAAIMVIADLEMIPKWNLDHGLVGTGLVGRQDDAKFQQHAGSLLRADPGLVTIVKAQAVRRLSSDPTRAAAWLQALA